ncbi:hypothetical protein IEQ34_006385 [Dendrobium chrysotoxum]|uniref:Uncharacterized protein n=1 Tax=Dendrobium chrysotoxum TaxID=161865 RepID=A0AAV7HCQ1_DENCH|nr:hypothetical protein IEQ34_006385 [Dendrobium chrysotoxum]
MLEKYQAPMMKAVVRLAYPKPSEPDEKKGKKRERNGVVAGSLFPGRASPGGVGGMSMTGSDSRRGLLPRRVVHVLPCGSTIVTAAPQPPPPPTLSLPDLEEVMARAGFRSGRGKAGPGVWIGSDVFGPLDGSE